MSARIYALQIASAMVLTLACLWAATQWAAAMRGYQPALGTPWIDVLGLKVYPPWKLFPWWIAFDDQASGVFARAGAVAALGGLLSGAVTIGGAAWRASLNSKNHNLRLGPLGGHVRRRQGKPARSPGCRARSLQGPLSAPRRPRACSGGGANPLRQGCRLGAADAAVLGGLGRHPRHQGRELGTNRRLARAILTLPTVRSDQPLSARFNPLLDVRKGPMRDVQNIADILVDPEGAKERRDHWEKTAHALLTGAILHVLYAEEEKTLARVAIFFLSFFSFAGGALIN